MPDDRGDFTREELESRKRGIDYPNWHEAAAQSRHGKAISKWPITVKIPRGTYKVKIVKGLSGDPYAVYASAEGIKVHDWKPTNTAVDRINRWRVW
jgi:hypothetical protein